MDRYYELSEQFLDLLVSHATVNGSERPLAEKIAEIMSGYGFRTEIQEIAENRANVVATYGHSDNVVIFNGHLDVVPTGGEWSIADPFHLTRIGDRFYGRGSCDMKGGIASMMAAAVRLVEEDAIKDCELRLLFVADEEVDGLGSQYYVAHEKPTGKTIAVIGEPTEMEANIAHRGVARFKVCINGRQCHSGTPYEGINANYAAARFMLKIEEFDKSRQSTRYGILPPPNMTVTVSHCGVKENTVPGVAELLIDCRTIPGDTVEFLQGKIDEMLKELFDGTEITYEISNFICVPPSSVDEGDRVCRIVKGAYKDTFHEDAIVTYFKGCCDMAFFYNAGFTQTLLMGPGSMNQAHVVDEYIEVDELHRAVDFYTEVVKQVQRI